jgi:hypothetical protein
MLERLRRSLTSAVLAFGLGLLFSISAVQAQTGPFSAPGAGGQNASGSANAAILFKSVAAPAGTASTTNVNLGLAAQLIPTYSGQVFVLIMFSQTSSVATDGGTVQCAWGTGTPPGNGTGPTGTAFGSVRTFTSGTTTPTVEHGLCGGMINVPTTAGPIWVDILFKAVTGGTYTLTVVDVVAFEVG